MLQDSCQSTASKVPGKRQRRTLGEPSSLRSRGRESLSAPSSQTLPLDHSPLHPGLSMDSNLCEGETEASTWQENVSGRLAHDTLLARHICDKTLHSASQILQLLVPYRATSGCPGCLNWN